MFAVVGGDGLECLLLRCVPAISVRDVVEFVADHRDFGPTRPPGSYRFVWSSATVDAFPASHVLEVVEVTAEAEAEAVMSISINVPLGITTCTL